MLITVTIAARDDYNEKISFIRSSKRLVIINQWLLRRLTNRLTDRVNRLYLCGNREGQSIIQMSILLIFGERYQRQATWDFREHFVFMNN